MTDQPANHWAPAIAADSKGNVYVAWDSYENGNYDVFLRRFHDGEPEPVVPIGTLKAFEARPSLAVDSQDRVWIAYEMGGPNWGKDFGRVVPKSAASRQQGRRRQRPGSDRRTGGNGVGIPLYRGRRVVVKCYADGRLQRPAANPAVEIGQAAAAQEFSPPDDGRRRAALALVSPPSACPAACARPGPNTPCRSTAGPGASRGCWPIRTAFWTTGRPWRPAARTA